MEDSKSTTHDDKPGGSSFYNFTKLPYDIRYLVWRLVYSEPRTFEIGMSRADPSSPRWNVRAIPEEARYYESLDTEVCTEATTVARLVRPGQLLPEWQGSKSSLWLNPPHLVFINWRLDYVTPSKYEPGCMWGSPQQFYPLYSNIEHLILSKESWSKTWAMAKPTSTGYEHWLLRNKRLLTGLRSVTCSNPHVEGATAKEDAYFEFPFKQLFGKYNKIPSNGKTGFGVGINYTEFTWVGWNVLQKDASVIRHHLGGVLDE